MSPIRRLLWSAAAALLAVGVQPATAKLNSCDGPITIGTTISQTGRFSTLADHWTQMTKAFEEEINKDGGIFLKSCDRKIPIQFVIYDDQSVPATAVNLYEKMASVDKVDVFVGPDWSAVGFPVAQVFARHKIPTVMANVASPKVYKQGIRYIFGTPFPSVPRWSENYFAMLKNVDPKPKTIFWVIHDNLVTKAIVGVWEKKANAQGIKTVGKEIFSPETKDFSGIILKIKAARPDIVYVSSFDSVSIPLMQQMRQLRVRAMDVHHVMATGSLARQLGGDLEGVSGEIPWHQSMKGGDYRDLTVRVLKAAGIDMFDYIWTMGRMASYLVMVQAIERAGAVDREKIRDVLATSTFGTPAGDITFTEGGLALTTAFTHQIQNGTPVIVWPPDRATGELKWPAPTWQ